MKKIVAVLSVGIVGVLFFVMGSAEQEQESIELTATNWQSVGPCGGDITGMAFGQSSSEIYAAVSGSAGQVFKSTNGGGAWKRTGLLGDSLEDIATAPSNPAIVGAVSQTQFFKSSNRGASWTASSLPSRCWAERVAFHPTNPNTIYIAGSKTYNTSDWKDCLSFFKSTDGGRNWTVKNFDTKSQSGNFNSLAVSRANPSIIYLGGYFYDSSYNYFYRIYKSTNGGNSWSNKSSGLDSSPNDMVAHPTDPAKAYAVADWGIYRTSDGGNSWQKSSVDYCYSLAIDRANPSLLYAGCSGVIYKSSDGGANWGLTGGSFPGTANALLLTTNAPTVVTATRTILIGTDAGIYKSLDEGEIWTASHNGLQAADVPSIAIAQSSPNVIYAELLGNGLYKSTTAGGSWTRLPEFVRCGDIDKIAVNPKSPGEVYITTYG